MRTPLDGSPKKHLRDAALVLLLLVLAAAAPLSAQTDQEEPSQENVRVFLDCQGAACDFDLIRREVPWVDWVRVRDDADVHLLVTGAATGAGNAFDLQFIGRRRFQGEDVSLAYASSGTDTQDERRRELIERFKLGLVRYASTTPAAEFLRVNHLSAASSVGVTPQNDPWNLWVFGVSVGGSRTAQSLTSSNSWRGSLSANRTSENWKIRSGARFRRTEDDFEFSDGTSTTSRTESSGTDFLVVHSLGQHWGVGGRASLTSATFTNEDRRLTLQPAVEYNIFPYSESSRRQFTFQYRVGPSLVKYLEETIFEVTEETIYEQSLSASLGLQQPWGGVALSIDGSYFLNDMEKNRIGIFGDVEYRIVRGLSLSVFASFTRVRDQTFLPRRDATDEEVLLRRRALETDFNFVMSLSFTYTFGSIFNNIVNPRFDPGGVFF